MHKKNLIIVAAAAVFAASAGAREASVTENEDSPLAFNAGADLRIRQEIIHNVPQMPGGGMVGRPGVPHGKTVNQLRFRPRVWAEVKAGDHWRLYGRLVDEFRAPITGASRVNNWPGEVVVDNLFIEGLGLFEDKLDFLDGIDLWVGRQDLFNLCGLNHIFFDGTPGDGSRSVYSNIARIGLRFTEDTRLDVFGLLNKDREFMRLGTNRSRWSNQLTGMGGNDTEMDDWGFGAVFSSKVGILDYQLFWIQKDTASFHRGGVKHPRRQTNLLGTKLVPHWTPNFSTPLELMAQVGENGADESMSAWAAYAGAEWKKNDAQEDEWKPFVSGGLLVLSGDRDAKDQDGGRHAWDPMWYRAINDGEMFLYGSNYGVAWWSNLVNLKAVCGVEFARNHALKLSAGPMFAETKDGLGGGDGMFKGFYSQVRYDFPILTADRDKGERFEILAHVLGEWFNPGDYYDTDRPAYLVRWQIDFKF